MKHLMRITICFCLVIVVYCHMQEPSLEVGGSGEEPVREGELGDKIKRVAITLMMDLIPFILQDFWMD